MLSRRQGALSVAMADPTDLSTIQQLKFRTQLQVEPVVVEYDKLLTRIEKNDPSQSMDNGLLTEVASESFKPSNEGDEPDVDDAPIVRFVQRVLSDALKKVPRIFTLSPTRKVTGFDSALMACYRKHHSPHWQPSPKLLRESRS